jgi:hypothetical protein
MLVFQYNTASGGRATTTDQSLVWRGQWSALTSYNAGDWIAYLGDNYIALAANSSTAPNLLGSWALLSLYSPVNIVPGAGEVTVTVLPQSWTNRQLLDTKVLTTGTNWLTVNGTVVWTGTLNGTQTGSNVGVIVVVYGST